jgi:abhydrolase domain-containing protein 12
VLDDTLLTHALDSNVIAIDYRGYGDSTGTPSEDGLLLDAQAVWDYVNAHAISGGDKSAEGKTVVVVGHSLGTAVSSRLVGSLADRGMCGI